MRCNGDVARGCGAVAGACPSPHVRKRHRHRVGCEKGVAPMEQVVPVALRAAA
jgi:hypothetical protein